MSSVKNRWIAVAMAVILTFVLPDVALPDVPAAELRVVRATANAQARYPVGTVIPADRVLILRSGETLTLVSLRTGRTYRVSGPKRGTVAAMVGRKWMPDENKRAARQGAVR